MFSATGGLAIGSSFQINKPLAGITVTQKSQEIAGSTITQVKATSADTTVPTGTYEIRFSTPVTGYTGSRATPSAAVTSTLTVVV